HLPRAQAQRRRAREVLVMPLVADRVALALCLGLGTADVLAIDLVIGPRALGERAVAMPAPVDELAARLEPPRKVAAAAPVAVAAPGPVAGAAPGGGGAPGAGGGAGGAAGAGGAPGAGAGPGAGA